MVLSGRVMFSASEDGFAPAVHELQDVFGRRLRIDRLGPDLGLLPAGSPTVAEVAAACFRRPMAYVRHLSVEQHRVERAAADLPAVVAAAVSVVTGSADAGSADAGPADAGSLATEPSPEDLKKGLAVQAWASGAPKIGYSAGELATSITGQLSDRGYQVTRAGSEFVLSCCITTKGVLIGLNRLADSLSDWPGGRVRLGKDENQVSRAEFKLEELFQLFPLDLPPHGQAIDLGAAPGGWTRILRQHGLDVWAIDPGDMAPALLADRRVHHERTTAGEFFRSSSMLFDVAVNDMRMDPDLSCSIMVDAAHRLKRGAYAIVTLKTGTRQPVDQLHRCLDILRAKYDIIFARQLHHNRHELTVVGQRRGGRG